MLSDRELLELAAKACGYSVNPPQGLAVAENLPTVFVLDGEEWNPLTDDGDALRLAVKLNIAVHPGFAYTPTGKLINYRDHANRIAATRRAIVRAAAEIGRQM